MWKGGGKGKSFNGGKGKEQRMHQMYEEMMGMWYGQKGGGGYGGYDDGWGGKGKVMGKFGKKGKSKGGKPSIGRKKDGDAKTEQAANLPWKSRLSQAYSSTYKLCPVKDVSVVYTTSPEGDDGLFTSTVTSDKFPGAHQAESPQISKKLAEESAAMVALQNEFPDVFATVPEEEKDKGAAAFFGYEDTPKAPKGEKRKSPSDEVKPNIPVEPDAKSKLNSGLMILLGRSLTKGDTEFGVNEVDGHQVGTVTLNCLDQQVFEGEPVAGVSKEAKKLTQFSAATVALASLQDQIDAKIPEHEARKAEKKASFEAKKLEKEAAALAAGES